MKITDLVIPIVSSDWDERELSFYKSTLDGYLDFLGNIYPETKMTILISNNNDCYQVGYFVSLNRVLHIIIVILFNYLYYLKNFLKEGLALEKFVEDPELFNRDRVSVDFFEGTDHAVFHKSTELGFWNPFVVGGTSSVAATTVSSKTTASLTKRGFTLRSWIGSLCFDHLKIYIYN